MNKHRKIRENWYIVFVVVLAVLQVIVFTAWGEHSFIAIHDNLDLFVAHNKMMKNEGIFFSQAALAPMLGGVPRDALGSEWNLFNILFYFFSPYTAYVIGYFLKLTIGFYSFLYLVKDVLKEDYPKYRSIAWIIAAGFSMIPVFPAYGIAFVSIPLVIVLLRRIYKEPKILWYGCVFLYPLASYFSYFGFFILAYLGCTVLYLWYKNKKFPTSLFGAFIVLALGYITFEYRLFREMLFSHTVTIRNSMVIGDASVKEMFLYMWEAFVTPVFHAGSSHIYWILPIGLVVGILVNINYLRKKEYKEMGKEPVNLLFLLILFNCFIYGLYYFKPFRDLFELLLPPLKGFQFNRTIFFNPFLWYLWFFFILKKIWDAGKQIPQKEAFVSAVAVIGTLVCMFMPQVYNDFYNNCYHHAYEMLKHTKSSQLSFQEFYSQELFEKIKKEIHYNGEWSAAYGMHPAVLQYNGIATLDGYLGLYSEDYKQQFRKLIWPALESSEEFRVNFNDWGARAYLFSGTGENTYRPERNLQLSDDSLWMDGEVFRQMGGKYIFSRIEISNADELGLELQGVYGGDEFAVTIYVYQNQ